MTEEQFKECFEANFGGLYVYSLTMVKDSAEAKDIVQTSFIKMWEKGDAVNEARAARAFLYKVVYRLSLNIIRSKKIKIHHHQQLKDISTIVHDYPAEEKELKEKIHIAINELPERCREVFFKVRVEGMKYREVAKEMQISGKTVETQMLRAMKFMRQRFSETILAVGFFIHEILNMFYK